MVSQSTIEKRKFLKKLRKKGFIIKNISGDHYELYNSTVIYLKYCEKYGDVMGIKKDIINEARKYKSYFILFIIKDTSQIAIIPFNIFRDMINKAVPTRVKYHRIRITRDSIILDDQTRDLSPYHNNLSQIE
ncbi:MAG: hypothetical protein EU551_00230 [Promethearchaeota archaeon]|nr:MAG: hypothetical protein EU551_00230 [Candidatus Lokiarchaeota archaeon]